MANNLGTPIVIDNGTGYIFSFSLFPPFPVTDPSNRYIKMGYSKSFKPDYVFPTAIGVRPQAAQVCSLSPSPTDCPLFCRASSPITFHRWRWIQARPTIWKISTTLSVMKSLPRRRAMWSTTQSIAESSRTGSTWRRSGKSPFSNICTVILQSIQFSWQSHSTIQLYVVP